MRLNNLIAFVIPNHITSFSGHLSGEKNELATMAALNGFEIDANEKIVQLWFMAPDYKCDNLARRGIDVDGKWYRVSCELIPYRLVKSLKEGDEFSIKVPTFDEDFNNVGIATLNGIVRQQGSRYKAFGNFEDALARIID